jgi:glucose/mannose-6-phosphate isomerase
MSFSHQISEESIRKIDVAGMTDAIAGMGSHITDAVSLMQNALKEIKLPSKDKIRNIVVAGLGGSAIGGDLARSYLLPKLPTSLTINRTYVLPAFTSGDTLVIVSSYSGDTEETLSMYDDAKSKGAQIVCISTGGALMKRAQESGNPFIKLPTGFQPRAALAYSFVPILLLLDAMGFTSGEKANLDGTAQLLTSLAERYGPKHPDNAAFKLAEKMQTKAPVIYSASDFLDTVNLRWRGQIQENAKHVAFGNVLPEMNHNEINGWDHPRSAPDSLMAIFLRTSDENPRVAKRFAILKEVLQDRIVFVEEVQAEGSTPLERMFSLIALGDWTSLYLAILEGIDPSPVPVISTLKKKLLE